jgi:phosphoribosylaminoimidazole carboxylase PurE protein
MPRIHVVAGSSTDEEAVRTKLLKVLEEIGADFSFSICSAHRNAGELADYVRTAVVDEGAQVFIGVAGMAAALPGALAGLSRMMVPVLAVPLDEHGIDSCIYMPPGVPVFTMGVGSAGLKNAAIGACQVLAVADAPLSARLARYLEDNSKPAKLHVLTHDPVKEKS